MEKKGLVLALRIFTRFIGLIIFLLGYLWAVFTNLQHRPTNFITGWSGVLLIISGVGLLILKRWARFSAISLLAFVSIYNLVYFKRSVIDINTLLPCLVIVYLLIPKVKEQFK